MSSRNESRASIAHARIVKVALRIALARGCDPLNTLDAAARNVRLAGYAYSRPTLAYADRQRAARIAGVQS